MSAVHGGRVTAKVRALLDTLPASHVATNLESLLFRLIDAVDGSPDAARVPAIRSAHISDDDGAASLGWYFPGLRVVFYAGDSPDPEESCWVHVSDKTTRGGRLDDMDLPALLRVVTPPATSDGGS